MANRIKEDERNERIIRGLLKLPENRRCINCNSLGPQYVCINFWTFICTTCSGIHREYTHRVKSVSMAKFTSQEVSALQGGGNGRAREVYFKEWDPQRHSAPDSSNVERLRDFIRHVYVDRRYSDRSIDKPPRAKPGEKDDSYESRRVDGFRGGSKSPPYGDRRYSDRAGPGGRSDDRSNRYNYDERRSPGYDQESRSGNNYKRSPVRFEVVDDRRRDDRFGNGRRFDERRFPDGESKSEGRSPNRLTDMPSPPMVRPVRDILGENAPPLRVGEPPKANGGKPANGFAQTQRTASSSSLGSNDGGSVELKSENEGSLIDFNADPEPSAATSGSPPQSTTAPVVQSVAHSSPSVDGGNWASFDFGAQAPAQPQAPTQSQPSSNANTLEALLFELSAPAPAPVGNISGSSSSAPTTSPAANTATLAVNSGTPAAVTDSSTLPFNGIAAAAQMGSVPISAADPPAAHGDLMSAAPFSGDNSSTRTSDGQWSNMQQNHPPLFNTNDSQSSNPQFTSVVQASSNQNWNSPTAQNAHPQSTFPQPVEASSKQSQGTSSSVPAHSEAKTSERKALPEDLFAINYPIAPVSIPSWHTSPLPGMGFGMHYPTAAPMQNFSQSSKPTNPFDLNSEPTMVHAPSFPSMTSLQGSLSDMGASSGLARSSSLGNPSQQWMPSQSQSYGSQVQSPSYASALPPSAFMGQQVTNNAPSVGKRGGSLGGEADFFRNPSTDQQHVARYSVPATPSSVSSSGGNPFG